MSQTWRPSSIEMNISYLSKSFQVLNVALVKHAPPWRCILYLFTLLAARNRELFLQQVKRKKD